MGDDKPEGFDKLPKRFKDYVTHLENRVTELTRGQPVSEPTSVAVVSFGGEGDTTYLPNGTRIEFRTGDAAKGEKWAHKGNVYQVGLSRDDPGALEIYSMNDALLVEPRVSNVVMVRGKRR